MSYPTGFDARGLNPRIIIKDIFGVVKFTWEHAKIDPSPTQDFDLVSWQIEGGVNTFHGIGSILIDDRNQALLDTTDLGRPITIKNGWEMIIELGKDQAGLETWFDGIIEEPEMIEEEGTITKIQVTAIGYGVRTAHRFSRMKVFQKKTADGLALDNTDTEVKISEIFKQVLTRDDHFAHSGLPLESKLPITNLVSYHTFEDDLKDRAGDNIASLGAGTAKFVNGKIGKAFDFDNTNWLQLANEANFDRDRLDPFSISMWIKGTGTGQEAIWEKGLTGNNPFTRILLRAGTVSLARIEFRHKSANGNQVQVEADNIAVRDGNWHHIVVTHGGLGTAASMTIYLDGVSQTLTTIEDTLTGSTLNNEPVVLGVSSTAGGATFTGQEDDVRFYKKELTAEEVKDLFRVPFTTDQVDDIDVKMPDFQRQFQSFGLLLNELANIANALYGITPTKDAYLRLRGVTPSGFLITNKLTDPKTTGWPIAKLLISRQERFNYKESTINSGYTIIHGTGSQHDTLDVDQTSANAVQDINPSDVSFGFTAKFDNISKVGLFLSKIGTIDKNLHVCIVDKAAGGGPNRTAIKQRVTIRAERLEREVTTAGNYFEVSFNDKVALEANTEYFILLGAYPDAGELRIDYQTGTGNYYLNDAVQTGDVKFRTYHSKTMHLIGQNVIARQSLRDKEHTMNLSDFPNEETALIAMEGMLQNLTKIKRIYNPIVCSAPDDYLDIGKTCDVIDGATGLEDTVDLMGFSIGGGAYDGGNLGAENMLIYVNKVYN